MGVAHVERLLAAAVSAQSRPLGGSRRRRGGCPARDPDRGPRTGPDSASSSASTSNNAPLRL
jgi:hypothetical protein